VPQNGAHSRRLPTHLLPVASICGPYLHPIGRERGQQGSRSRLRI
jgi:hypothetical protein